MILHENSEARLLNIIRWGNNPFKKFVSTSEIKEELDLVKSRDNLIKNIKTIVKQNNNFILPIIGDIGSGKTHLFWALRNNLYQYKYLQYYPPQSHHRHSDNRSNAAVGSLNRNLSSFHRGSRILLWAARLWLGTCPCILQ